MHCPLPPARTGCKSGFPQGKEDIGNKSVKAFANGSLGVEVNGGKVGVGTGFEVGMLVNVKQCVCMTPGWTGPACDRIGEIYVGRINK